MYRLLIVDDEPDILDWLYELFSGIEELDLDIYKAYSATSALEQMSKMRIDIVLTDIHMPRMDGIQLMEKIRQQWPLCKIIFLTGYDEFEYAYQAIHNDVSGYILKNEDDTEIIAIVEKTVRQIEAEMKIKELVTQVQMQIKEFLPVVQREYLLQVLCSRQTDAEQMQNRLKELSIPFDAHDPVLLLLARFDEININQSIMSVNQLICSLEVLCHKFLSPAVTSFGITLENQDVVFILNPGKIEQKNLNKLIIFIRDTLETIQTAVRENIDKKVSFVLGTAMKPLFSASEECLNLRKILDYQHAFGDEMLITDQNFEKMYQRKASSHNENMHKYDSRKEVSLLETYLERGKNQEFFSLMTDLTKPLLSEKSIHDTFALKAYFDISMMFLDYINRFDLVRKIPFHIGIRGLTSIEEHSSWDAAVNYLYKIGNIIFTIRNEEQDTGAVDIVSKIKDYIGDHLSEDLSLARLSEVVYFNPSYLSRFFKNTTGINLIDYITEAKMQMAKELLEDQSIKIHEIASMIGIESAAYFARFFKKNTGMTPQEYRDACVHR